MKLGKISIEGFKAFSEKSDIDLKKMNIFFGSNSCGKSTAIQSLLLLKQTLESKKGQYDILLNGKYTSLGSANEIINVKSKDKFSLGFKIIQDNNSSEINEMGVERDYEWKYIKREGIINELKLEEAQISMNKRNILFQLNKDDEFTVMENGELKNHSCYFNKLLPEKINYVYDKRVNYLFNSLYNDILKIDENPKKKVSINLEADCMSNWKEIESRLMDKLRILSDKSIPKKANKSNGLEKKVIEITKEFNEFVSKLENELKIPEIFGYITDIYLISLITVKENAYEEIKKVIDINKGKYEKLIIEKNDKEEAIREINLKDRIYRQINKEVDEYNIINSDIEEMLNNILYLGPIRERPRSIYEHSADQNSLYVGSNGQYLPGVLAYNSNTVIEVILPGKNEKEQKKLSEALDMWAEYIGIADKITTKVSGMLSVEICNDKVESTLMNVGVGVSQVLPVLVMGLLSNENDLLIYEQPELHLHPYVQTKLIDFFIMLSKLNRQLIIESHSEYFLKRLQYKILEKEIDANDISVVYFSNKHNKTRISYAKMDNYGDLNYPEGFCDTTERLIDEILERKLEDLI